MAADALSLPPGPLRDKALAEIGDTWSHRDPDAWLAWMRAASSGDQAASLADADGNIWKNPEDVAFLKDLPPAEQLPFLRQIYHDDAAGAAAVIESPSAAGVDPGRLDAAAEMLATAWRERDPATARAFALSLPDPDRADSVLLDLVHTTFDAAARAAAAAAIRDPVTRRKAEQFVALTAIGLSP